MAKVYVGHAKIKFLEGEFRGSSFTVTTKFIKHSFKNKSDYDNKKKYMVQTLTGKYYKAQIIHLEGKYIIL